MALSLNEMRGFLSESYSSFNVFLQENLLRPFYLEHWMLYLCVALSLFFFFTQYTMQHNRPKNSFLRKLRWLFDRVGNLWGYIWRTSGTIALVLACQTVFLAEQWFAAYTTVAFAGVLIFSLFYSDKRLKRDKRLAQQAQNQEAIDAIAAREQEIPLVWGFLILVLFLAPNICCFVWQRSQAAGEAQGVAEVANNAHLGYFSNDQGIKIAAQYSEFIEVVQGGSTKYLIELSNSEPIANWPEDLAWPADIYLEANSAQAAKLKRLKASSNTQFVEFECKLNSGRIEVTGITPKEFKVERLYDRELFRFKSLANVGDMVLEQEEYPSSELIEVDGLYRLATLVEPLRREVVDGNDIYPIHPRCKKPNGWPAQLSWPIRFEVEASRAMLKRERQLNGNRVQLEIWFRIEKADAELQEPARVLKVVKLDFTQLSDIPEQNPKQDEEEEDN